MIPRQTSQGSATSNGDANAHYRRKTANGRNSVVLSNGMSNGHAAGNASASSSSYKSSAAQAANSLALLLREDRSLTEYNLHASSNSDDAVFRYAASLLQQEDDEKSALAGHDTDTDGEIEADPSTNQELAQDALEEIERKLALVESLGERVSRTSPEEVAGPLLRLHGYNLQTDADEQHDQSNDLAKYDEDKRPAFSESSNTAITLVAVRERCDRIHRQGDVLEGVARRVESTLDRGLVRMEKATSRLERVLNLSASLKMILRLQFESNKLQGYYLQDLRDLTRAAASIAIVEDLLSKPELNGTSPIDVVEAIRPQAKATGAAIRQAAASLLAKHQKTANSSSAVVQLGATLQVYYHLGELPQAAWSAVDNALKAAEKASFGFWSPTTLSGLTETATAEAKAAVGVGSSKKPNDANMQRTLQRKLRELRAEAAAQWATGITDAALQVWNLHQVLCRKSDPTSRQVFVDVVSAAPIPDNYEDPTLPPGADFSIFSLFWHRLCDSFGERLKYILQYENGKFASDVSALYPTVRASVINMLGSLNDTMQAGFGGASIDDTTASGAAGALGGSAALDDAFLQWSTKADVAVGSGLGVASADTWTKAPGGATPDGASAADFSLASGSITSMSVILNSSEWKTLQGNHASGRGLFRLQQAFLIASSQRLCAPLPYMFPENISVDDDGHALVGRPLLPSRHDIQRFDTIIRQELSLADPREGGGDLSAVTMISENVVDMVSRFCEQASGAVSGVGDEGCLDKSSGSPTEALVHDLNVVMAVNYMAEALQNAPEKVFLAPYRPAVTPKLEEAASICEKGLEPARKEIDKFAKVHVLDPLCKALNRRVGSIIGRMHQGIYLLEDSSNGGMDNDSPSFVQRYLTNMYENMATELLSRLPPSYAARIASTVAAYSINCFVSNVALLRPLGESARLHITQDLADFELALEQFVLQSGGSNHLSQVGNGKPYLELRAVRQLLFWAGFDDKSKTPNAIAKGLLREVWIKDVRPSTICHYLFSFAPSLLSSPHQAKRMRPEEYVQSYLVKLDGGKTSEQGEADAWMTIMSCYDTYQQRASAQQTPATDGDSRVASVLTILGHELLERRRH